MSASKHNLIRAAVFDDDDTLMSAVRDTVSKGYQINEVYTPFPVHGLDKAMGLPPTRIAITSFIYGVIGCGLAILMTWYMMVSDWPQDIGGKPSFTWFDNMPAFVPIMFELTVFCAAHLMVFTFMCRCVLYPGKTKANPDPRTTDDKFLMELSHDDDLSQKEEVVAFLKARGALEVF